MMVYSFLLGKSVDYSFYNTLVAVIDSELEKSKADTNFIVCGDNPEAQFCFSYLKKKQHQCTRVHILSRLVDGTLAMPDIDFCMRVIDRSDCVISYWYPDLHYDNQIYQYALNTTPVIDITDPETTKFLRSGIDQLPNDWKHLEALADAGVPHSVIAREFDVSNTTVRHRLIKIKKNLYNQATDRKERLRAENYLRMHTGKAEALK